MKNILVDGYFARNAGDDAFFFLLARRYPDVRFYAWSPYNIQEPNFESRFNWLENKILKKEWIEKIHFSFVDALVVIGGSMFMEGISRNPDWSAQNKPFWILGANFGPYSSQEYFLQHKELFAKAKQVSFREEHSADLFTGANITHYPDLVFSIQRKALPKEKQAVISLMDIQDPRYDAILSFLISYYQKQGYRIVLASFCSLQNDDKKALELKEKFKETSVFLYDGHNLEELLELLDRSQIVAATRFHAVIMGLICHCQVLPIVYSPKTEHVLEQLGYTDWISVNTPLEEVEKRMETDPDYLSLSQDKLDALAREAERHFESLDTFLGKKGNKTT